MSGVFYDTKAEAERISIRRAGEAGLQEEIQADGAGDGVERIVAAADATGDEAGVHAVFRADDAALYDIPVLREPGIFVLQRVDKPGDDVADGERVHLHEGERAEVPVSAVKERADADQLWADAVCVFGVLRGGPDHVHMEIYPAGVPHHVPGAVQHRSGAGAVGAVCVFPGYPVPVVGVHHAIDVYVGDILHDRQLPADGAKPVPAQPGIPVHPIFSEDRDRGDHPDGVVPPADGGGRGNSGGAGVLDVQEVQRPVFVLRIAVHGRDEGNGREKSAPEWRCRCDAFGICRVGYDVPFLFWNKKAFSGWMVWRGILCDFGRLFNV